MAVVIIRDSWLASGGGGHFLKLQKEGNEHRKNSKSFPAAPLVTALVTGISCLPSD